MKKIAIFLTSLLLFTSCQKHDMKKLLGIRGDEVTLKSMSHPLSYCNDGIPIGGGKAILL